MSVFSSVLCAVDSSSLAARVFRHAAGLAAVSGAKLTVLTTTPTDPHRADAEVRSLMRAVVPLEAGYLGTPQVRVVHLTMGQPIDAILDQVQQVGADLIVVGTHARSGLSRWFLGSTSAAVLQEATCPVLVVPPGQVDVVSLDGDGATFHPGVVLAAVDLDEENPQQLALAGRLAALARAPLAVMTVAPDAIRDDDAAARLRTRTGGLAVDRVIVRRGVVAEAIDEVAVAEHAGLVVMGVRERSRGEPGATARAVLKTRDAVVLAVPRA